MKIISKHPPKLADLTASCTEDLAQLNQLIIAKLESPIPLIQEVVKHILKGNAKRLRPLVVILSARATSHTFGDNHLLLAAIIEFVHTATLLHDDVVDESRLRRGNQTANSVWGNSASVLVGDFLYSRAFQMLTELKNDRIMHILATTTNMLAEGEVLQLMNRDEIDLTEADYYDIIYRKTAKLFESSAETAAIDTPYQQNLADYGRNLGLCFQIIDDLLDYTGETSNTGKNIGDDLKDGKMTLPLIYALKSLNDEQHYTMKKAIEQTPEQSLPDIIQFIQTSKAIDYCYQQAEQYAKLAIQAITPLPNSMYKTSLTGLVEFALKRNY